MTEVHYLIASLIEWNVELRGNMWTVSRKVNDVVF